MYTLHDLRVLCRKDDKHWCPYYLARHMIAFANVVVYNYQYMLDPKVGRFVPPSRHSRFPLLQWLPRQAVDAIVCCTVRLSAWSAALHKPRLSLKGGRARPGSGDLGSSLAPINLSLYRDVSCDIMEWCLHLHIGTLLRLYAP